MIKNEAKKGLVEDSQQVEASEFLVGDEGSLASAFKELAEVFTQQKQAPIQVTKAKIPPIWAKESFSDYRVALESVPGYNQ